MEASKWSLFFGCLCLNVFTIDASDWTINLPPIVKGLVGCDVTIPCSYNYPQNGKKAEKFTGIWKDRRDHIIYHPDVSKILPQYQNRTQIGDVEHKDCSLRINHLQLQDVGTFYFRIEIDKINNYSFLTHTASIIIVGGENMTLSVRETVKGQAVEAFCSMVPVCPNFLPTFTWNHPGDRHSHPLKFEDGQWKATVSLTFKSTRFDHNTDLLCTARHRGGRQQEVSKVLKVKYAPVNVNIVSNSEVKEGETVRLTCSCDAYPPANRYEWYNEAGALVYKGSAYVVQNVSRHLGALYCIAANTQGKGKSSLVSLSVLYAPEIKTLSSCFPQGDAVKCVCAVACRPPCSVQFSVSDTVIPGTKMEGQGSLTIGLLETESKSYTFVHCLANNTEGTANYTLPLPVYGKMQNLYIIIAIGVAVVVVFSISLVVFFKICGRTSARPSLDMQENTGSDCETASTSRAHNYERYHCNKVYDDLYANVIQNPPIYANM